MAQQTRTTLKTYFQTGDTPTEAQFIDLIDSSPNPTDDGTTGSGSYVRATSPTLVTPALGTPASGTLTNCTGLPLAGVVDSTTEPLGVGSLEVGHASDSTITRVSAGTLAIEGQNILTAATGQPLDSDLTAIAALSPSNDDIIQRKAGAWTNRTMAQLATDLSIDNTKIASIGITIDGGGSAITTGIKGYIEVPYACTINRVTMLADVSGSAVVDIWKDTYANYPPLVGDSITASAKPTISSATKSQDSTLTGWTTSVAAGDILAFNVDSASTITRLHLILKVTKT